MGLIARDNGSGDFELLPEGTYVGRSIVLADLGTQTYNNNGETKLISKILISWELSELTSEGKPFTISNIYTNSLHKKASLRKDLEAWRGRTFTDEELQEFHLVNILNKGCLLGIIHKETNDKKRARISSIMGLPKGTALPPETCAPIAFDLDSFDSTIFTKLPEWTQEIIKESPEYQAISAASFTDTCFENIPF